MSDFVSAKYWEERYSKGGNSGAGSYGRLADYKASFINTFLAENSLDSVIDFGCGDGNLLSLISPKIYTGLDVSEEALTRCRERFSTSEYFFVNYSNIKDISRASTCLSIDVIFHLVEDDVFEIYMRNLFMMSTSYVVIYSSDHDASWPARHVRHRCVSNYVKARLPEWKLLARIPNPYPYDTTQPDITSFCDFLVFGKGERPTRFVTPVANK